MTPDAYVYAYEMATIPGPDQPVSDGYTYGYEHVNIDLSGSAAIQDAYTYGYEFATLDQALVSGAAVADGYVYGYENVAASTAPDPTALKVWDGTQWVAKPRYVWNGTAWVQVT